MRSVLVAAALCGGLLSHAARAGQVFDPSVIPALRLGISFGNAAAGKAPFELGLQFQHHGAFPPMPASELPRTAQPASLSVEMITLTANVAGVKSAFVLGHDVLADRSALNADGEDAGGSNWIWWVAGGAAIAAAIAVAGGGDDEEGSGPTGGQNGCGILNSTINPPGEIDISVIENCPPLPDVP